MRRAQSANLDLALQPKQEELYRIIEESKCSWIGYGGSRGGGKSGSLRRIMLARRFQHPGTWGIIVRRVFDELKRNHIDELFREYPELQQYYKVSDKELTLPGTNESKLFFGYAETLEEVKRKFMGGQYMDVFVDQAEQFTEKEHREMKQAARWPGKPVGSSKYVMFFNMGGSGIQFLKRIFHTKEYKGKERPGDYDFVHAYAWDNVSWVEPALDDDGFTVADYYGWSDQERMEYCLAKSDYGINLNSQDEALRKRDLFGSWNSLEGAYFGAVWDRDIAVISQDQVNALIKPWWNRWMSMDWGRAHYASAHWHARGLVAPEEALKVLGWTVDRPLKLTITYREMVENEQSERDFAKELVARTPEPEKKFIKGFWVSPEIFGKRGSAKTIPEEMDAILGPGGLPGCEHADNDRIGGWSLMYNLLLETKRMGRTGEQCWVIGANCPEVANALPVLMRDPDELEDVEKKDTMADDVGDDLRYGMKSALNPRIKAPVAVRAQEVFEAAGSMTAKAMAMRQFAERERNTGGGTIIRPMRRR